VEKVANDNYAGQLRLLRLLLGRDYKPISTEALAALVHMKVVSVRGIEAGRRELRDEDRAKIAIYAGAKWDEETSTWILVGSKAQSKKIPFTKLAHESYTAQLDSGRSMTRRNHVVFKDALEFLVNRLSAREANLALLRLHYLILEIAEENGIDSDGLEYLEECNIFQVSPSGKLSGTYKVKIIK
jgi:hypothetical protein